MVTLAFLLRLGLHELAHRAEHIAGMGREISFFFRMASVWLDQHLETALKG